VYLAIRVNISRRGGFYIGAEVATTTTTLESLMESHARSVYQQAYVYTGSAAMAEDVMQNVFIAAYRHLGGIRNPGAWLARATLNASRNMLRERARHPVEELPDGPADLAADPSRLYEERDVVRAILELPAELREVIVLVYYEDRPTREAARMLGVPDGTVRSRLTRARRVLSHLLEEEREG
jgi:RNA polymerase sigma-70 factor (ECF subfamily)